MPRTLAERSTLFTPSTATAAQPVKAQIHHGIASPKVVVRKSAVAKPNIP